MELSRRVVELAARSEGRIVPHFHICLQSGSDRILKRMLRPYTTARFARIVREIRSLMPDAGIGTDVIVGFPGETDGDHRRTLEFVKEMPFTYLHVFPYSDRAGTRAAGMDEKVGPETLSRRSEELRRLSESKNRIFRKQFLGRRLRVVTLDESKNGSRPAVSGNYLTVQLDSSVPGNQILEVDIIGMRSHRLIGRPVPGRKSIGRPGA
jgi:threonylcarbamoyladenosine tRNA methylthiotransferase MtaB